MFDFLPWQQDDAARLLDQPKKLPHALLIHGLAGSGKHEFALALAATLLCEDPQHGRACWRCSGCQLVASGNHPDLMRVRPDAIAAMEGQVTESDSAAANSPEGADADGSPGSKKKLSEDLRVDQIRALEPWYHRATHRGRWRIVVLYPAEALTIISANALLKALEEPPADTLFFLTSDMPDRLLSTILSRCQKFALTLPDVQTALAWLQNEGVSNPEQWLAAAGGAPLAARMLSQTMDSACPAWIESLLRKISKHQRVDVAEMADELAKSPASNWLMVLQRVAHDVAFASVALPVRYYPGLTSLLSDLGARVTIQRSVDFAQWLNQQTRLAHHPLNAKLFAQACLQRFCDVVS